MAVTNGPQIQLRGDIGAEVGLGSSSNVNLNHADIRGLIGKASGAQNSMSEYYGASNAHLIAAGGTFSGNSGLISGGVYGRWRRKTTGDSTYPQAGILRYPNTGSQYALCLEGQHKTTLEAASSIKYKCAARFSDQPWTTISPTSWTQVYSAGYSMYITYAQPFNMTNASSFYSQISVLTNTLWVEIA